jgi:hypothetical protein
MGRADSVIDEKADDGSGERRFFPLPAPSDREVRA